MGTVRRPHIFTDEKEKIKIDVPTKSCDHVIKKSNHVPKIRDNKTRFTTNVNDEESMTSKIVIIINKS